MTINFLTEKKACIAGVEWYFKNGSPATVQTCIAALLTDKKYEWCSWLLTNSFTKNQNVMYAIYAAESVLSIYENKYPDDTRPRKAIEAASHYLSVVSSRDAAWAAEDAARAAGDAAWAAGDAAWAAGDAAWAARDAAWAAGDAAWAARAAARDAGDAAKNDLLIKIINYGLTILEG